MGEPSTAPPPVREAVYSVGRFQPPTIGHAAMIQALAATGKPAYVFVSSSRDPLDKNPLTSAQKVAHLRKMFPATDDRYKNLTFVDTKTCLPNPQPPASAAPAPSASAAASSSASAAAAAANAAANAPLKCGGPIGGYRYLVRAGYTKLTLVGGSDREKDFGPEAPLWNSIKTAGGTPPAFQALERDAADKSASPAAAAMSGTKARGFVVAGDRPRFRAAVTAGAVTNDDADWLFDRVKEGLDAAATAAAAKAAPTPKRGREEPAAAASEPEPEGLRRSKRLRGRGGVDPEEGKDLAKYDNASMFEADDEPVGGRHRRTRRRKSRSMRKKRIQTRRR